ncbi:MAG: cytochrome c [Limisphaerales bacterium]
MIWKALMIAAALGRPAVVMAAEPGAPRALDVPELEVPFQVTDRIFSGGLPEGDAAFAALQKLGVKTIISVDGTKPEVERAARYGLRYIHLPHGYDGIPTNTAARLVKAAQTADGPIYLHCHHGRHRGPAAVGLIAQATAGWTTNQAVAWLRQAGTSADYAGLFRDNVNFRPPAPEFLASLGTNFTSRAEVSGLVEGMVEVDRRWEHLKEIQQAGWRAPAKHPDLVPATEALLLQEAYRELLRVPESAERGDDFLALLRQAGAEAEELHAALKAGGDPARVEAAARAVGRSCSACHRRFRN